MMINHRFWGTSILYYIITLYEIILMHALLFSPGGSFRPCMFLQLQTSRLIHGFRTFEGGLFIFALHPLQKKNMRSKYHLEHLQKTTENHRCLMGKLTISTGPWLQ